LANGIIKPIDVKKGTFYNRMFPFFMFLELVAGERGIISRGGNSLFAPDVFFGGKVKNKIHIQSKWGQKLYCIGGNSEPLTYFV